MINVGNWGGAQWVLLTLYVMPTLLVWSKHGEPQKPYNGFINFASIVILSALLWWGGFWA